MSFFHGLTLEAFPANLTSSLAQPFMSYLSSALLLGSVAVQHILGNTAATPPTSDLESFIQRQYPIAYDGVLCNIGSEGCQAQGSSPGVVIASPSREDPPYFYTWTRDSGLVFKSLVDIFVDKFDPALQDKIQQYVATSAQLQGVSNPSGELWNGEGLGEAKFNVDLTAFTGDWGRPQRDGPALRATAIIGYAKWLVSNGHASTAEDVLWPVVQNDLAYVAQYWNQTGFDPWEEVYGSSFFTVASQHRALVEGASLARTLGFQCKSCEAIAPHILCFMQSFWSPSAKHILANIHHDSQRSGLDANSILGSIHTFDPFAGCDAATFQPCSDRALASHKAIVDSFRSLYSINDGISPSSAVAIGRYPEDVYYGGQAWYLTTLAAAEQLYDALLVWKLQGSITVTEVSLSFFQPHLPSITTGTYDNQTSAYASLTDAILTYADGFVKVVANFTPVDGTLDEQFDRNTGEPLSARDLTWSYASFLTAIRRRAGLESPGWINADATLIPATCSATSVFGVYATATATTFPSNLVPGTPPSETPPLKLPRPSTCLVRFKERVSTRVGQNIRVVGNQPGLGRWDPWHAVPLDALQYTATDPSWRVTIALPAGQVVEYKYVMVESGGSVVWEAGSNRVLTVPSECEGELERSDEWQS
ncbi:hypothetical protein VdG1_02104 [Verticillium dahliae VDG1]|nr:hypothetical protein VdG1_02104 [Verticillium dahliae VDG1]